MSEIDELREGFRLIDNLLNQLQIKHHATGGVVSAYYGEPRSTFDIDIVIEPFTDSQKVQTFSKLMWDGFIVDPEYLKKSLLKCDMIQGIDRITGVKVDLHVGEGVPGELGRSTMEELFPGLKVSTVSREDAILSKLIWIRKGSVKSRRDVVMMLRDPRAANSVLLESLATELEVKDLLDELRQLASQYE